MACLRPKTAARAYFFLGEKLITPPQTYLRLGLNLLMNL